MLFIARKEMSQDKGPEDRKKKTHDTIATPSSTTRAPAKEKAPARTMTRAQARAPVGSTTRTLAKTKGPARKKAKN